MEKDSQRRGVSDVNYRMKHEVGGWYVRLNELLRGIWMDDVLRGGGIVPVPSHYFLLARQ